MSKVLGSAAVVLLAAVVIFLATIYAAWAWAVCASFAFDWFMHPMFPSLPEPTRAQLVGFSCFVCIIGPKFYPKADEENKKSWAAIGSGLAMPWIILFAAYCLHLFYQPGVYLP